MQVLKFKLSGKTAFFKKPEVNSYFYFTFGQIHKVALLGMLGAIMGYDGYGIDNKNMNVEKKLPEFYERLSNLKIGIKPNNCKGYIPKKIQTFNNSVGYASQEQGGNLIVKEQWLENPSWNIYILLDSDESNYIKDKIVYNKCEFIPYLGKNDHIADISDIDILEATECNKIENINSLFLKQYVAFDDDDEIEDILYKYEEKLPISLDTKTILYTYEKMVYSNYPIDGYSGLIYNINNDVIAFF